MYRKKIVPTAPFALRHPDKRLRTKGSSSSADTRLPNPKSSFGLQSGVDRDQTLINQNDDDAQWIDEELGSDDDNEFFHWEEEATLFSDLLDDATSGSDEAELTTLVESLRKPFELESRQLKKEIAQAYVPVVNQIKEVFSSIERTVDLPFGTGVVSLNAACKELEKSACLGCERAQKAQAEHMAQVTEALIQLEHEYAQRQRLWVDFESATNKIVNPVIEMLNEAPANIEKTITSIEKQSRVLEKEGASTAASATEKTLKELLNRLK